AVTVSVSDDDGGPAVQVTDSVTVQATGSWTVSAGTLPTWVEGAPAVTATVATVHPGSSSGPFTASIDWGDGHSTGPFPVPSTGLVQGSHGYDDESPPNAPYQVSVTVTHG